eukprot:523914-Rhodomonas_salina.3
MMLPGSASVCRIEIAGCVLLPNTSVQRKDRATTLLLYRTRLYRITRAMRYAVLAIRAANTGHGLPGEPP